MSENNLEEKVKKYATKAASELGKLAAFMIARKAANAALMALSDVTVTNIHKSDVTGDKKMSPTNEETILQESKHEGSKTEATLSQDEVAAQKGKVDATETNAKASTTEATAVESGAQAMKTKAGACDIQTKGMKMN